MKTLLIILMLGITYPLIAQDCNCTEAYEELINVVENDYAGFEYKVSTKGNRKYKTAKRQLKKKAKKIDNQSNCEEAFVEFISFFTDKHLNVITDNFSEALNENNLPPIFEYDPSTNISYLQIPSFEFSFKAAIDSILDLKKEVILQSEIFIIDVSNNEGGADSAYTGLIPFFYTQAYLTEGADFKSTPGNIAELERYLEYKDDFDEETLLFIETVIAKMKANKGAFVNASPEDTITVETYYSTKKVALIITNAKSAAEGLILGAQQSKKVTLFGLNSGGARDFLNVRHQPLNNCNITIGLPMSKSTRVPQKAIDDVGIVPDVKHNFGENTTQKIQFIKAYYDTH